MPHNPLVAKVEDLLQRRTDLSTFLVHLTRAHTGRSARENLLRIVEAGRIEARSAFGPAERLEAHLDGSSATQKAVCFTETPLEHAWMMLEDIDGSSVHFEPYGLALTKTTARKAHCNPVWYSDISTRGGRSWPMFSVNALIDEAVAESRGGGSTIDPEVLQSRPIFRVSPFFEQMGPTSDRRKEFWWEREWRHVDDFVINFPPTCRCATRSEERPPSIRGRVGTAESSLDETAPDGPSVGS
jgi:hypothetical protein